MHRFVFNIVIAFILFGIAGCSLDSERKYDFDNFYLTNRPEETPELVRSGMSELVYPGARQMMTGAYGSRYYGSAREGVLILESEDPPEDILAFYNNTFEQLGWQVIQSNVHSESESVKMLLMAERARRLCTVIMRRESLAQPITIKLYFTSSTFF